MILDHPHSGRPHRVYLALTNRCNRACPWCSTCSSPAGSTFLAPGALSALLPEMPFEAQLEGGEPTVHPALWEFVHLLRENPLCQRLILCTNGVLLPRKATGLGAWVERLGTPLTIKLSINHHLLEQDAGLLALAWLLHGVVAELGGDRLLVINARYRAGTDNPAQLEALLASAGLGDCANLFPLQRYGFARDETGWAEPFLAGTDFRLANPDGSLWGTHLVARSEAMGKLA